MAKGNHASYSIIGFTVLVGIVAILGTLFYIGGAGSGQELVYAETYVTKSVSGLSVGSVVNFRGVKVGEVSKITFVGSEYEVEGAANAWVYIQFGFNRGLIAAQAGERITPREMLEKMVKCFGLRATVTASGITGLSRIELDVRKAANSAPLEPSWIPKTPYIPSDVSLLDSFSDSAVKVMNQINGMDLVSVWSNVSATAESLARATESLRVMLEASQDDVGRMADDLSETMGSVRECANTVRDNPSALIRERVPRPLPETSHR